MAWPPVRRGWYRSVITDAQIISYIRRRLNAYREISVQHVRDHLHVGYKKAKRFVEAVKVEPHFGRDKIIPSPDIPLAPPSRRYQSLMRHAAEAAHKQTGGGDDLLPADEIAVGGRLKVDSAGTPDWVADDDWEADRLWVAKEFGERRPLKRRRLDVGETKWPAVSKTCVQSSYNLRALAHTPTPRGTTKLKFEPVDIKFSAEPLSTEIDFKAEAPPPLEIPTDYSDLIEPLEASPVPSPVSSPSLPVFTSDLKPDYLKSDYLKSDFIKPGCVKQ
eukprot:1142151_1